VYIFKLKDVEIIKNEKCSQVSQKKKKKLLKFLILTAYVYALFLFLHNHRLTRVIVFINIFIVLSVI
jgi:hypothetical protein